MLDSVLLPIDLQHEESWNKALPQARDLLKPGGTLHLLGIVPDIGQLACRDIPAQGVRGQGVAGHERGSCGFRRPRVAG